MKDLAAGYLVPRAAKIFDVKIAEEYKKGEFNEEQCHDISGFHGCSGGMIGIIEQQEGVLRLKLLGYVSRSGVFIYSLSEMKIVGWCLEGNTIGQSILCVLLQNVLRSGSRKEFTQQAT